MSTTAQILVGPDGRIWRLDPDGTMLEVRIKAARMAELQGIGADEAPPEAKPVVELPSVGKVAAVALAYHGYKRTGSIGWAMFYALAGRVIPGLAVPIAFGQGFGKKRECP